MFIIKHKRLIIINKEKDQIINKDRIFKDKGLWNNKILSNNNRKMIMINNLIIENL